MKESGAVGLSIALVDGDRTIWARGFGWADKATKTPVTKDTLFHIGSASKTMTATAVMQLGFSSPFVQREAGSSIVAAGDTLTILGVTYRLTKAAPARPRAPRG